MVGLFTPLFINLMLYKKLFLIVLMIDDIRGRVQGGVSVHNILDSCWLNCNTSSKYCIGLFKPSP